MLRGLQHKSYLQPETVIEIEECLKERDTAPDHVGLSSPLGSADVEMSGTGLESQSMSQRVSKANSAQRLDKKQVEQRIEEDRERHKRMRETQWATPVGDDSDEEFYQLQDETSSVGSDDYRLTEEETDQKESFFKEHFEDLEGATNGAE